MTNKCEEFRDFLVENLEISAKTPKFETPQRFSEGVQGQDSLGKGKLRVLSTFFEFFRIWLFFECL